MLEVTDPITPTQPPSITVVSDQGDSNNNNSSSSNNITITITPSSGIEQQATPVSVITSSSSSNNNDGDSKERENNMMVNQNVLIVEEEQPTAKRSSLFVSPPSSPSVDSIRALKTKDCNLIVKVFEAKSLPEARARKKDSIKNNNNKNLKRAQNLLSEISSPNLMTFSDTTDPYCLIQLDQQKQRTRTIPKKLNPFWCEEFTMEVIDPNSDKLIVSVVDEKKYTNDDLIGKIVIPINTLKDQKERELWFPLQPSTFASKKVPQIQILVSFKPVSLTDPSIPGKIFWKVLCGRNLSSNHSTTVTSSGSSTSISNIGLSSSPSTHSLDSNSTNGASETLNIGLGTPYINWTVRSKKGEFIISEDSISWYSAVVKGIEKELTEAIDCITFTVWRYEPKSTPHQETSPTTSPSSRSKSITTLNNHDHTKSPDSKGRSYSAVNPPPPSHSLSTNSLVSNSSTGSSYSSLSAASQPPSSQPQPISNQHHQHHQSTPHLLVPKLSSSSLSSHNSDSSLASNSTTTTASTVMEGTNGIAIGNANGSSSVNITTTTTTTTTTTNNNNNNNNDIPITGSGSGSSNTTGDTKIHHHIQPTQQQIHSIATKEGWEQYIVGSGTIMASHIDTERTTDLWVSLYPKQIEKFGDVRLKLKYSEEIVLPLDSYTPLVSHLQEERFTAVHLLGNITKQREAVASNLIRVFEKNGRSVELLQSLTELEIETTDNPDIIFRGNSLATKSVDLYMKLVGIPYLSQTIGPYIKKIYTSKKSCEIDPAKMEKGEDIKKNAKNLLVWVKKITAAILGSANNCPGPLREIFRGIQSKVKQRYPNDEITRYTAVSGFIFLRFFCPSILAPKLFELMPDHPGIKTTRTLILVAKTLQNLANLVEFGEYKEDFMRDMNKFVVDNMVNMKTFIDTLSTLPPNCPPAQLQQEISLEKELACLYRHLIKQKDEMLDEVKERNIPEEIKSMASLDSILVKLEKEVCIASTL